MKHTYIAAAAALILAACSNREAATNTENKESEKTDTEIVAPVAADGNVIELTDARQVPPGVKVDQLTVLDFNAVWCGPCRRLTPIIEEMAERYAGKVTFISIDVDRHPELFQAYNVGSSIPVVLFLRPDGKRAEYRGISDLVPAEVFESVLKENLQ